MPARDLLFLLFINVVWGLALVAAAASLKHFPPLEFTWFRFTLLSAVLVPFLRWHEGQMGRIFWIAMTGGTFNFALLFLGMRLAGEVSIVAIAGQLAVPFATILSIFFLGEVVHWRRWSGIILSFVGIVVIGFDPRVIDHVDGFLAVVGAAAVGSVSSVLMRQIKHVPVFQMQSWIATLSWPVLMLLSLLFESGQWAAVQTASFQHWGGIVYTALLSSLVAHAGFYYMLQRYEVSKITPFTLLSPLFTVIFGVVLLGEGLTWRIVVGGLVTLAGVAIISLREPDIVKEPAV
ncbi:MAG: EamA family transporter [Alphaproteobacteria bacterium]|nr:EamA family transporter [Alphaproteobacteria bacterium]